MTTNNVWRGFGDPPRNREYSGPAGRAHTAAEMGAETYIGRRSPDTSSRGGVIVRDTSRSRDSHGRSPVVVGIGPAHQPGGFIPRSTGGYLHGYRGYYRTPYHHHHRYSSFCFGFAAAPYPVYEPYPVPIAVPTPVAAPTPYYPDAAIVQAPYGDDDYGQADTGYAPYSQTPAYSSVEPNYASPEPLDGGSEASTYAEPSPGYNSEAGTADQAPAYSSPQPAPAQGEPLPQPGIQGEESSDGRNDPEHVMKLMTEGTQAFSGGDYDRAARLFLQVAMPDPSNVDAWLAYAVARFATGDYAMSATAIRRGVLKMPEVVDSRFDIRDRYSDQGDFAKHLQMLERFVADYPERSEGLIVLGFVKHFTLERETASRVFASVRQQWPSEAQLADVFLKAKPLSELPPAGEPPQGEAAPQGNSAPPPQAAAFARPQGLPSYIKPNSSVQSAVETERALRDAGLTGTPLDN